MTGKSQFCYSNPTFSWKEPWKFHGDPALLEALQRCPGEPWGRCWRIWDSPTSFPAHPGSDRSSSGCNPQVTPWTPLPTPPLQDNPIYHPDDPGLPQPPLIFLSPTFKRIYFGQKRTLQLLTQIIIKKDAFDEGLRAGLSPITLNCSLYLLFIICLIGINGHIITIILKHLQILPRSTSSNKMLKSFYVSQNAGLHV